MKKLALLLFFLPIAAQAQLGNVTLKHFAGTPTGPCQRNQQAMNDSTGAQYNCLNGSWNLISSGGGTTTNAATFDNGGLGAASGATFNGSTAVDISYNTIGAANLALSDLFSVAVNTALLPGTDNAISIDAPSFRYINFWSSGVFGWTNGAGAGDTGVSRDSAGVVDIGNGTAGDASGTGKMAAAQFTASNGGWSAPNTSTGANCTHTSGNNCIYSDTSGFHENAGGTDLGYLVGGGTAAVTSGDLLSWSSTTPNKAQDSNVVAANVNTATGTLTNHQIVSGAGSKGTQTENNPQLAAASTPAAVTQGYTNDGSTGTANGLIAKLNGNDQAVKVGTSDTEALGIVVSGGAVGGTSQIAVSGTAACTFDNTSTAGHYVQISTGTAGDCHDAGATLPTSGGTIIGRVADGGAAGSHNVAIALTPPGSSGVTAGLFLFGNCSGNESAAGTWGVMSLGLVSNSGQCTQAWSNLSYTTVSHACTLKNLYANSNNTGANASDGAVTAWTSTGPAVALASSALTCTMGTGQTCNDTTHTVSLSAGSIVSIKIVTQTGTTMGYFSVGMECD